MRGEKGSRQRNKTNSSTTTVTQNKGNLSPRIRLANFSTFDDVVKSIRKAKNILVVTGAGIEL